MAGVATLYNTLLPIMEAHERFVNRDEILSKLQPIFLKYKDRYGICLVHRHCELQEGEMMVGEGFVSKPERDVECYPERWLATGEPYEFNRQPPITPPESLFKEFREVVGDLGVLGICYIYDDMQIPGQGIERTVGRTNIMEILESFDGDTITTCWLIGPDNQMTPWYGCSGTPHVNNHDIPPDS